MKEALKAMQIAEGRPLKAMQIAEGRPVKTPNAGVDETQS